MVPDSDPFLYLCFAALVCSALTLGMSLLFGWQEGAINPDSWGR